MNAPVPNFDREPFEFYPPYACTPACASRWSGIPPHVIRSAIASRLVKTFRIAGKTHVKYADVSKLWLLSFSV